MTADLRSRYNNLVGNYARARTRAQVAEEGLRGATSVASRAYETPEAKAFRDYVRTDRLVDAEAKRNSAYRTRDWTMATLWRIAQRHHADEHDRCVCGRGNCEELRALEPVADALNDWEQRQIDNLSRGRDCYLPEEHPAVAKSSPYGRHLRGPRLELPSLSRLR